MQQSPSEPAGPAAERPLWTPASERARDCAMSRFRRRAEEAAGRPLPDYDALHAWSVDDADAFWALLADELLPWRRRPERVRSGSGILGTRWFEGGTLNVADVLLWPEGVSDDDVAIVAAAEDAPVRRLDRAELRREVARVQAALRRAGLEPGDHVAAFAANVPETVALFLACAAEGLVFTSGSPDFGAEALTARFAQVRPRLLVASSASRYGGRRHDTRGTAERLGEALDAAAAEVGREPPARVALPVPGEPDAPRPEGFEAWEAWTDGPAPQEPETRALPFDHPLYVLYSSGTTGTPKALIHRAGGVVLSQLKEHVLHCDVRPGDRVLYYTTTGWMMWNWLVAALGAGAAPVLVDGSPMWPDPLALWRLARDEGVTFFGTSARYLHGLAAQGTRPRDLGLPALRTVASTGSPLSPAGFRYVYEAVGDDVHLASISGGTDIASCFLLGVPTLPVHAGQLQRPGLGVDLAVFDEQGRPLEDGAGELVCRAPLPAMPLGLVGDEDGSRYHAAYAARFPDVWTHGDRIERTPEGGYLHHGRSDATLNPGGVRIGSAEVTAPLLAWPEIEDAVAVSRRDGEDEEIWLLIVVAGDTRLDEAFERRVRDAVRRGASPRHVPKRILAVPALPRTRSGKTMEIGIARLLAGRAPGDTTAAANPEAFDAIAAAVAAADADG